MAAGSSAPELFTSVAGVTVDSDVGVGTIVGYVDDVYRYYFEVKQFFIHFFTLKTFLT